MTTMLSLADLSPQLRLATANAKVLVNLCGAVIYVTRRANNNIHTIRYTIVVIFVTAHPSLVSTSRQRLAEPANQRLHPMRQHL